MEYRITKFILWLKEKVNNSINLTRLSRTGLYKSLDRDLFILQIEIKPEIYSIMEQKFNKKIIVGNWKMNPYTLAEAKEIFSAIKKEAKKIENVDVIIAPPAIWLGQLKIGENGNLKLAAQNMHWEEKGAFTGEISAEMIKETGARYVIIGHSERRIYFGETDEAINKKILAAFKNNLVPVLCVGETAKEKSAEQTQEVIKNQLTKALENISRGLWEANKIVIAYEPVWAIGSGATPTFDEVLSSNLLIKKTIANIYGRSIAEKAPVIYGGSVNALNAKKFVEKGGMDGLLVGGASVKTNEFISIIRAISV